MVWVLFLQGNLRKLQASDQGEADGVLYPSAVINIFPSILWCSPDGGECDFLFKKKEARCSNRIKECTFLSERTLRFSFPFVLATRKWLNYDLACQSYRSAAWRSNWIVYGRIGYGKSAYTSFKTGWIWGKYLVRILIKREAHQTSRQIFDIVHSVDFVAVLGFGHYTWI